MLNVNLFQSLGAMTENAQSPMREKNEGRTRRGERAKSTWLCGIVKMETRGKQKNDNKKYCTR